MASAKKNWRPLAELNSLTNSCSGYRGRELKRDEGTPSVVREVVAQADLAALQREHGKERQLANRLDKSPPIDDEQETENAWAHGNMRRRQGYSVPLIVAEVRILYRVITDTLHANLLDMDVSSIIPDLYQISDSLNVMLAESLRSFLAGEQIAA